MSLQHTSTYQEVNRNKNKRSFYLESTLVVNPGFYRGTRYIFARFAGKTVAIFIQHKRYRQSTHPLRNEKWEGGWTESMRASKREINCLSRSGTDVS